MNAQAESLSRLTAGSLTDVILTLCASGHFGVREAIAAATRQEPRQVNNCSIICYASLSRTISAMRQRKETK